MYSFKLKYCENGHIKIVKEQLLMYLKDKLDTFVKEFNSNTFFNIGAFIRLLLDKKKKIPKTQIIVV